MERKEKTMTPYQQYLILRQEHQRIKRIVEKEQYITWLRQQYGKEEDKTLIHTKVLDD